MSTNQDRLKDYRGDLAMSIAVVSGRKRYEDALRVRGVERLTSVLTPYLGEKAAAERARNITAALVCGEEDIPDTIVNALSDQVLSTQGYPLLSRKAKVDAGSACIVAWTFARRDAEKAALEGVGENGQ